MTTIDEGTLVANPITLEGRDDDDGLTVRSVSVDEEGNLVIKGHDLGPGVERLWGLGNTEYEFFRTVPPEGVRQLRDVLGIDSDSTADLLAAVKDRFAHPGGSVTLELTLREAGIDSEFWSRVGS